MLRLDLIRDGLSHQRVPLRGSGEERRAAVAVVLAGEGGALRLCIIRRAEHPRDPWSGHIALPGGRVPHASGRGQASAACAAASRATSTR